MKIAYNAQFGGFGLSHDAIMRFAELKGLKVYAFVDRCRPDGSLVPFNEADRMKPASDVEARETFCVHYCTTPEYSNDTYWSVDHAYRDRADHCLIRVIEEMGKKANGHCASLKIDEVSKGTLWRIDEYDGNEHVATHDSYEWNIAT
jgi:hypothetical protein